MGGESILIQLSNGACVNPYLEMVWFLGQRENLTREHFGNIAGYYGCTMPEIETIIQDNFKAGDDQPDFQRAIFQAFEEKVIEKIQDAPGDSMAVLVQRLETWRLLAFPYIDTSF